MTRTRDLQPFARLPGGLAPLGFRNFALYWIGFAASNTGKWIEQTGAVWVAYELGGSAALLGLIGLVRAVPTLLLTPFAGVIVDRVDQRRLIFVTQGLALVTSLITGILLLVGRLELWQLYLEVGLQAAIAAVDTTARQALFPRLVPRTHLVESVTLTSIAARSSGTIGPAIGGIAIALLGDASPFLLNAATFLFLMGALAAMKGVIARTAVAGASFMGDLSEGFRHMLAAPVLNGLLKLEIFYAIFQMNQVMVTIVGREVLGVGPEGLGGLLSAIALGAVIGTAALLLIGATDRPGRFVTLSSLGYAGAMVVFAVSTSYAVGFVALILVGVFDAMVSVTRNSIMQLAAPSRMRGRVMANQGTVVRGLGPLAQTQSGALAEVVGGPVGTLAAAAVLAASSIVVAVRSRPLWEFSRREAQSNASSGSPDRTPGAQPGGL